MILTYQCIQITSRNVRMINRLTVLLYFSAFQNFSGYVWECSYCDGAAVLAKQRDDSVSNPLIVPLVGYIFERHVRFIICSRYNFLDPDTRSSASWSRGQWVNEWKCTIKKIKKLKSTSRNKEQNTAYKITIFNKWKKNVSFKDDTYIHPSWRWQVLIKGQFTY